MLLLWICIVPAAHAQIAANSDPTYQALRNLTLSGESVSITGLDLKRDAGTFHLRSGVVCFTASINGKVTGAVFEGDGSFVLDAPASERGMLKLLTKENEFAETFSQMVLRFTDSTYDEIKSKGSAASGGCDADPLKESQHVFRGLFEDNLDARILDDVWRPQAGGIFWVFIHGKHYNHRELFRIDTRQSGEQVQLLTLEDDTYATWASFPLSSRSPADSIGMPMRIEHQQLDTTIEGNATLSGKATTTFVSRADGLRVVPFDLFPALRVQGVTADGQPLEFVQEDKNKDSQLAVILPHALAAGQSQTITTTYSGKEAVRNEGGGNYYPISRSDWFPNNPQGGFGEFVSYDMIFRIPKDMKMAATGQLVSESTEGSQNVTVWKSEAPQTVAGFNFGKFKAEEAKFGNPQYFVQSFANVNPPDWVQGIQHAAADNDLSAVGSRQASSVSLGLMNTTSLNKKALAEGELAVGLYSDYFGPPLFKHVQITQQTACNYGQSWPGLVWIPICYYFDTTVRHQLGLDVVDSGYWQVVTPHEVAHQWWGNTVGFDSYRDQWMSEGFSDMSASLYLTLVNKDPQKFIAFWNSERDLLLQRNAQGFRAIDAGPVTMGYRLSNAEIGFDLTRRLIYPKGAFILHMLRMMMHENSTGDQTFKQMMQDFVRTYTGKSATTEDFKGIVEKHMTAEMDIDGNHRMDWFFDEYVYGTQLPSYTVDSSFSPGPDGTTLLNLKVVQSNVNEQFRMLVPLYLEMTDGKIVSLGRAKLVGNDPLELSLPLKGLTSKPKRAVVNYYDDVLASPGQQ